MSGTLSDSFDGDLTYEEVRQRMAEFVRERDWEQFHTPRNLLLAFMGEAGELSEIFQWSGEVKPGLPTFDEAKKIHVGEELADCSIYLVRLAQQCGINLPAAILRKMERNALKYPADKVRGSSKKYTAYKTAAAAADAKKAAARAESNLSPKKALGADGEGLDGAATGGGILGSASGLPQGAEPRKLRFDSALGIGVGEDGGSRALGSSADAGAGASGSGADSEGGVHWPSAAGGFLAACVGIGLGVLFADRLRSSGAARGQ